MYRTGQMIVSPKTVLLSWREL